MHWLQVTVYAYPRPVRELETTSTRKNLRLFMTLEIVQAIDRVFGDFRDDLIFSFDANSSMDMVAYILFACRPIAWLISARLHDAYPRAARKARNSIENMERAYLTPCRLIVQQALFVHASMQTTSGSEWRTSCSRVIRKQPSNANICSNIASGLY